jgi:hypothetical protein
MGISVIFDVTGATIFRVVRPGLPEPPPRGSRPDPLQAAMDTITAAHREVVVRARGTAPDAAPDTGLDAAPGHSGVALPA